MIINLAKYKYKISYGIECADIYIASNGIGSPFG